MVPQISKFSSEVYRGIEETNEVMVIEDHLDHIKECLKEKLEAFCDEKRDKCDMCTLKLEGRYGKLLWTRIPKTIRERYFSIDDLKQFSATDRHSRIFLPDFGSPEVVKQMLHQERKQPLLETYDIKFTLPDEIDMRVKFKRSQPEIIFLKKKEKKHVVFDVLYLHRKHDIRMSLSQHEVVQKGSHEYSVAENLLKTLSCPESDGTIKLVPKTDTWCVNFIRHKKRETYYYRDKFLISITEVAEYRLRGDKQVCTEIFIYPDSYERHCTELELHHCSWICAFGRSIGLSPEQSLALLMDSPAADPGVAAAMPHPWQPKHILQDFQDFWKTLDTFNDALFDD